MAVAELLYVTRWMPDAQGGGTQKRAAAHLRALAACGRVHLLYLGDGQCRLSESAAPDVASVTDGATLSRQWLARESEGRMQTLWRRLTGQAWGMSGLIEQPRPALMAAIHAALPRQQFDAVFAFHLGSALLVDALPLVAAGAPRIIDWDFMESQNVLPLACATHQQLRWSHRLSAHLHAAKLALWERRILQRWDQHLCSSPMDVPLLQSRVRDPGAVRAIANTAAVSAQCPAPPLPGLPPTALFVATFGYWPNEDGAMHLLADVWPAVRVRHPAAQLLLVGRAVPPCLQGWHGRDGVQVHPDVPDVLPFYGRAHVALAPLRFAVGSNLKVPEAMAQGRPVLGYRPACSRHSTDSRGILAVDDVVQFTQTLNACFDDLAACAAQGQLAWAEALQTCSAEVIDQQLAGHLQALLQPAFRPVPSSSPRAASDREPRATPSGNI